MNVASAFGKFDGKQKGYLTLFEAKCALLAVTGMKIQKRELHAFFTDEQVTVEDLTILSNKLKPQNPITSAFLSTFADDKGECTLDRFRTLALQLGLTNSTEVFLEIDKRKRGVIDLGDFLDFIN